MTGVILALLAALGFGSGAVFARVGLQNMSPQFATLISLAVSAAAAMAIAAALHPGEIVGLGATALGWLFLVGLLNFPLGRMFNYLSVRLTGVAKASTIVAAAPLFAMTLAVVILGESLDLLTLLGAASITGGIVLTVYQR